MNGKSKLLVFATLSLLCASFVLLTPSQAYASDSFDTKTGNEYVWEVALINATYFTDPYLTTVGDRLRLVITVANTTEIGGVTYDSIYGKLYHNSAANRTWIQIDGPEASLIAIFNGTYMDVFSDLPYIISRDYDTNHDWMFDIFLQYGIKSIASQSPFLLYSTHPSSPSLGSPYEEYFYLDGVLFTWGYGRYNESAAWEIHTVITKYSFSSSGGIPGFAYIPVVLSLTGILAIYTLLAKKKQPIPL